MAIMAVEGSLSLTVVDKAEGVVVVFGGKYAPETVRAGKSEGVVGGEGVVGNCRGGDGAGNGAEGGVVVVCCDAIALFEVHHLRHTLIAIVGIEEFITCATLSEKRSRCHRFCRIPNEMSPRKLFL